MAISSGLQNTVCVKNSPSRDKAILFLYIGTYNEARYCKQSLNCLVEKYKEYSWMEEFREGMSESFQESTPVIAGINLQKSNSCFCGNPLYFKNWRFF